MVKFSVSMTEDERDLADAIATRLGINRSKVFRHLILYQGLCGGDMPLTSKILDLPEPQRTRVIAEILKRARMDDPPKPQSFALWVKETLGKADAEAMDKGGEILLKELIDPG